jgi:hypothetical protein
VDADPVGRRLWNAVLVAETDRVGVLKIMMEPNAVT